MCHNRNDSHGSSMNETDSFDRPLSYRIAVVSLHPIPPNDCLHHDVSQLILRSLLDRPLGQQYEPMQLFVIVYHTTKTDLTISQNKIINI